MKKARILNIIPFVIPVALLVFAWFNPFYDHAAITLEESTERSLKSLAILEDLHLITKASSSVHIPIVSGRFEGAAESIRSATKYLSIATIAGMVNEMLLKISHLKIFIFAMLGIWLFTIIHRWRTMAFKVLWLGLLINPGLSVFTHGIHWIDQEIRITDKDSLHDALQKIHEDFSKKEEARKKKLTARRNAQLARDKKRGKDKLTFFQKVGDDVGKDVGNAALHLEEDFAITGKAIHFATKKIKTMIINYFTSMLLLSFLLPVGYLFICYQALKLFFPAKAAKLRKEAPYSHSLKKFSGVMQRVKKKQTEELTTDENSTESTQTETLQAEHPQAADEQAPVHQSVPDQPSPAQPGNIIDSTG